MQSSTAHDFLLFYMPLRTVIVADSVYVGVAFGSDSGAPGNICEGRTRRRRGYATRWCGDDVTFRDIPGTMDAGWKAAGFDCGLKDGDPIACALHPELAVASAERLMKHRP